MRFCYTKSKKTDFILKAFPCSKMFLFLGKINNSKRRQQYIQDWNLQIYKNVEYCFQLKYYNKKIKLNFIHYPVKVKPLFDA